MGLMVLTKTQTMFLDAIDIFNGDDKKRDIREFLRKVDHSCWGLADASKLSILASKTSDNISKMIASAVAKGTNYQSIREMRIKCYFRNQESI